MARPKGAAGVDGETVGRAVVGDWRGGPARDVAGGPAQLASTTTTASAATAGIADGGPGRLRSAACMGVRRTWPTRTGACARSTCKTASGASTPGAVTAARARMDGPGGGVPAPSGTRAPC